MKIGVLGAGTWGTALARLLANKKYEVIVWSALEQEVEDFSKNRVHPNLPGMVIPKEITYTSSIEDACVDKDVIVFAVPSVFVRSTAAQAAQFIPNGQIIVDVAKGIESDSLLTMTQVIKDEIEKYDKNIHLKLVALSGPTHAEEVAKDIPTTIVSASSDKYTAEFVQDIFMSNAMRVYTNFDTEGVELCGALKNIMALAAGISRGLGYGDNTRAALMTRGLAEMERLGKAMGCYEQTFSGLAGIGDLIVTATSEHSRNNKCGYLIGQGMKPEDATKEVGMVVEGINALPAAIALSKRYKVDMPITYAVNSVIKHGEDPKNAVKDLMEREKSPEVPGDLADLQLQDAVIENTRFGTSMRRVITYGTFDMLHYGHINFLKKARLMGDYLIVALSTDDFNFTEKNKQSFFDYEKRKMLIESLRYVDLVIPEESWEQKIPDISEYQIDTFVIGDSWRGRFDYLKGEGVDVVYLPRTPEISTSQIKKDLH